VTHGEQLRAVEMGVSTVEQKGLPEPKREDNCSGLHQLQGCNQKLEGQKGSSCNRLLLEDHTGRSVLPMLDKDTTVSS